MSPLFLRWLRQAGAALALAGALLSPFPVFGGISSGHSVLLQVKNESAFVLRTKDICVPKAAKENMIGLPVPNSPMMPSYDPALRRNTVIDEFSLCLFWCCRKIVERTNSNENVINGGGSFPVVVDARAKTVGSVFLSETTRHVSPLNFDSMANQSASRPPQGGGEKGKKNSSDGNKSLMVLVQNDPSAFEEKIGPPDRDYERGRMLVLLLIPGLLMYAGLVFR